jgi:dCTP deaminase
MGGILSGLEIARQVELGEIKVTPWDPTLLNPASLDLRLGRAVAFYARDKMKGLLLDCKEEQVALVTVIPDAGFVLVPGHLYLMHTEERVWSHRHVPVLDGKSSIGRLGVQVHMTAGYGDPGFDGQYTLEVTSVYPVRVYAGMRFCQMRFHTMFGELQTYAGNYTGEFSEGPVPSRVWKQFK